jgi:hypothetical protein
MERERRRGERGEGRGEKGRGEKWRGERAGEQREVKQKQWRIEEAGKGGRREGVLNQLPGRGKAFF